MSVVVNGSFHLYETWVVQGVARDHRGDPIDLTDAVVYFKMSRINGEGVLSANTLVDGILTEPENGKYEFIFSEQDQRDAEVSPGNYKYEVKVIKSDTRATVQNIGTITVLPTLFTEED